jgi:hypothetical protein
MSIAHMKWAFSLPDISPVAKFCAVALADFAGQDNTCFPSQERLAEMTNLSERAIRKGIAELEKAGHLTREGRWSKAGGRTSNLYKLECGQLDYRQTKPARDAGIKPAPDAGPPARGADNPRHEVPVPAAPGAGISRSTNGSVNRSIKQPAGFTQNQRRRTHREDLEYDRMEQGAVSKAEAPALLRNIMAGIGIKAESR